jgi:hypothetical protein
VDAEFSEQHIGHVIVQRRNNMTGTSEWLSEARARLAKAEPRRPRPNTIAARVEALLPEIQAARAAGKTWSQIAAAMSDGEPLNADAVRVAFARSCKTPASTTSRRTNARTAPASVSEPTKTPNKRIIEEDSFPDMFAPMFDARDTRGRNHSSGSNEEARS